MRVEEQQNNESRRRYNKCVRVRELDCNMTEKKERSNDAKRKSSTKIKIIRTIAPKRVRNRRKGRYVRDAVRFSWIQSKRIRHIVV